MKNKEMFNLTAVKIFDQDNSTAILLLLHLLFKCFHDVSKTLKGLF
jgi:hypothetical protein